MTKREIFFAILTLLAGMLWGVAMSSAAASGADHTSVAGWLNIVTDVKPGEPAPFWLLDCHGQPCGYPNFITLPADAIRMTGRSGDAPSDQRVADWLVRHDGKRVRVSWTVEPKGGAR